MGKSSNRKFRRKAKPSSSFSSSSYPVYVGNIHPDVQISDLRGLFSQMGPVVEVTILADYGYVSFSTSKDATKAIEDLNQYPLKDQRILVDYTEELADAIKREESSSQRRSRFVDFLKRPVSHSLDETEAPDLREILKKRRASPFKSLNLQLSNEDVECSSSYRMESPNSSKVLLKFFIGDLFNPVSKFDLERLFQNVGDVKKVEMSTSSAIAYVKCSEKAGIDAISSLNDSIWMDNCISVRFDESSDDKSMETEEIDEFIKTQRSEEDSKKLFEEDIKTATKREMSSKNKKLRFFVAFSPAYSVKTYKSDIEELFGRFMQVSSCICNADGKTLLLQSICSEKQAVQCIVDANKVMYKGSELRVKFADGSDEDLPEFRKKYPVELRRYHSELIPSYLAAAEYPAFVPATRSEVIATKSSESFPYPFEIVEGTVKEISNKFVLINYGDQLIKLSINNAYINGKNNLGSIIGNNTFQTWPTYIKEILSLESCVNVAIRSLGPQEVVEFKNLVGGRNVFFEAVLLWKNCKPLANEIVLRSNPLKVFRGVIAHLYPSWGILEDISDSNKKIFFSQKELHNYKNADNFTLLTQIAVGDIFSVVASEDHVPIADLHENSILETQFKAKLLWPTSIELDPYQHIEDDIETTCRFLSTSSIINNQLPDRSESVHNQWIGKIEEIYMPGGGIVLLDQNPNLSAEGDPNYEFKRRVYFHRSRLLIDGEELNANSSLDLAVLPGDTAHIDIIPNKRSDGSLWVSTSVHWIALSIRLDTSKRNINASLSVEDFNSPDGACSGRIVYLDEPASSKTGPCISGVAIIYTGEFLGQKVQFDRTMCYAFGHSLEIANLSVLLQFGDLVYIKVKPYNSYCVEKLWIGSEDRPSDEYTQSMLKQFQEQRGLDAQGFDAIIRGQLILRQFIPIQGQPLKGIVKSLSSNTDGIRDKLIISGDCGIELEACSNKIYFFGRCCYKSDLAYFFNEGDSVYFETNPLYQKSDVENTLEASLVWVHEKNHRPQYLGQSILPEISTQMDSCLQQFLFKNSLTEIFFNQIITGKAEPKKECINEIVTNSDANEPNYSQIKNQAELLFKIKKSFGSQEELFRALLPHIFEFSSEEEIVTKIMEVNSNNSQ